MLAGLSMMCCRNIPPRFCANAVPVAVKKTNTPKATTCRREIDAMSSSQDFTFAGFSPSERYHATPASKCPCGVLGGVTHGLPAARYDLGDGKVEYLA